VSYYDYLISKQLGASNPPFFALIMAAMRKADSGNAVALRHAWPDVWEEMFARYNAPGGRLPSDPQPVRADDGH
jgi:hypothetical protein